MSDSLTVWGCHSEIFMWALFKALGVSGRMVYMEWQRGYLLSMVQSSPWSMCLDPAKSWNAPKKAATQLHAKYWACWRHLAVLSAFLITARKESKDYGGPWPSPQIKAKYSPLFQHYRHWQWVVWAGVESLVNSYENIVDLCNQQQFHSMFDGIFHVVNIYKLSHLQYIRSLIIVLDGQGRNYSKLVMHEFPSAYNNVCREIGDARMWLYLTELLLVSWSHSMHLYPFENYKVCKAVK